MDNDTAGHNGDDLSDLRRAAGNAWHDASLLVGQHAALASREAAERTAGLSVDVAGLVAGVVLLHGAALTLLAAGGFALYEAGLAPWLAALVVAAVVGVAGVVAVLWAKARLSRRTAGQSETLLALSETAAWLGTLIQGGRG